MATLRFLGRYDHTLDSKGRLTIPAKYRPMLEHGLVVTQHTAPCLLLFPREKWDVVTEKLDALPMFDPKSATLRRKIFSNAEELEMDGQGRILLPARLREYAGVENDVVVVGQNSFVELWSPRRWEELVEQAFQEAQLDQAYLANLPI